MAFEYHHMDKWGYANLDLCEQILEKKSKAVVVIAGASSSGKSFAANYLKAVLNHNGHKALILSLDQYNFGLSGIIPNKVNKNFFDGQLENMDLIIKAIKKVIYHVSFDDKYKPEVLAQIRVVLKDLVPEDKMDTFINGLYTEWQKLNFDEASVYNLKEASDDIRLLIDNKKVKEKRYSKVFSERVNTRSYFDGSKYDCFIVEGIYALDNEFLKGMKGIVCVKDFIDGNPKSLFLRRIIRDKKITSAPSLFTVKLYFKYIIKSYEETILPSRKNADVILNNNMSFMELRSGELYTTKDEILITDKDYIENLKKGSEIVSVQYQKDDYFGVNDEDKKAQSLNVLRLRLVSEDKGKTYLPSSLVHKGAVKVRKDNKIIRPINVLLKEGEVMQVWEDEESCLSDFFQAGFIISKMEKKVKTRLVYKGQKLTIREVENKGAYVEFPDKCDQAILEEIQVQYRREKENRK